MKKAILNGMTVLFAILLFSSCDALMEDALQDRDTTALETERDTYVTPDESTEEPTDPSTEIPTDELTEVSTEAPTEEPTDSIPDETLAPLFDMYNEDQQRLFMLYVELHGAEGCDMHQLTYRIADTENSAYSFTAVLNHRAYQPGDTIEITFKDLIYEGQALDVSEAVESGILKVSLSSFQMIGPSDVNAFSWTEDGRAVLNVAPELAPDTADHAGYVYSVTVLIGDEATWFSGIIIY
jgi:hypothetical protein